MYPPAKKARLEDDNTTDDEQQDSLYLDGCSSCESFTSASSDDSQLETDMESLRKPDASFIELIASAIMEAPQQKLLLQEIYDTLSVKYPYFQFAEPRWKNTVRHNLSVNDCFCKAEKKGDGKGHYWCVHPANVADFQRGDFRRRLMKSRVQTATELLNAVPRTHSATVYPSPYPFSMLNTPPVIPPSSQCVVPFFYDPTTQQVYAIPHGYTYKPPFMSSTSTFHTPQTITSSTSTFHTPQTITSSTSTFHTPHTITSSTSTVHTPHTITSSQPHPYTHSQTLPTKQHQSWSDNFTSSYMHPLPVPLVGGNHGNKQSRLPPLSLSGMVDVSPKGGASCYSNKARTFTVENILSP